MSTNSPEPAPSPHSTRWPRLAGGLLSVLTALGLGACGGRLAAQGTTRVPASAEALPTGTIAHGPFDIVVSARRISTGTFPNTGGNPFATREVSDFRLRFNGQPVRGPDGSEGRWWRVMRIEGAPRPTVLLATTGFVLATAEADGTLKMQPLNTASSSLAEVQWLDAAAGQPGPEIRFGIEAVADLQAATRLAGGRWLRLGYRAILDVAQLKVHAVEPWVPMRPGVPITAISRSGDHVRAFSPGRTRYVLAAAGPDYSHPDRPELHGLLVVDIASGTATEMRLDRSRFRFAEHEDIDAAWIDHHLVWQRTSGGEQLVPRERFAPWPWRARLNRTGNGLQLDIPRIDPAFAAVVQRLVAAQPGATVRDATESWGPGFRATLDGCQLEARAFGSGQVVEDRRIGIWPASDTPGAAVRQAPRDTCEAVLKRLASLVDAELATGRHDGLLKLK